MNKIGRFGEYGGQYVPEIVMNAVNELNEAYETYKNAPEFLAQLRQLYRDYANRPSLLYYAEKMTKDLGGAKVYLKREDLNHTGAHKINNVLGQILLAKRMGKKRIIAETGAGQHGVATATVAALFDMECVVYMGAEDVERQSLNAYRMELLGAKVHAVESGTRTLKDAINEAMRDWATNIETTFYCIGSVMGPHPYPTMVRDFQKIIGEAGRGIDTLDHAATIAKGSKGIFHGMKSLFLQNEEGQIDPVYSISAGLDYPGIGPEHAHLHEIGRAEYMSITDEQAVKAFEYLSKTEGVIPAIESSHAVAAAMEIVPTMSKDQSVVICLSGRGDKDVYQVARYRGVQLDEN